MSIKVLLREHPNRTIALATSTHALILRYTSLADDFIRSGKPSTSSRTSQDGGNTPRCMVEFESLDRVDLSEYNKLTHREAHGTLGLITVEGHIFLCVVTGSTRVATVRPGETVEKIHGVQFFCLSSSRFDTVIDDILSDIDPYEMPDSYSHQQRLSTSEPILEHPCHELTKMLSNGSFYYSTDFDLTNRLQDRSPEATDFDIDNLDESFLWNSYMINPLVKFRAQLMDHERAQLDASRMLTSVIRGYVQTMTVPNSSAPIPSTNGGLPSTLTLVSRLSCRRAGTRFNSRGIDDDGNVANFVETETIYWSPAGVCFSYAQVRGSVPVFWEQEPGLLPTKQNIHVSRGKEGTQPAFDKHFAELEKSYGSVHVINLLSEAKAGEAELTNRFTYGIDHCALNQKPKEHQLVKHTNFDFHAETKGAAGFASASVIMRHIERDADMFAYYLSEELEDKDDDDHYTRQQKRSVVVLQQNGVFRTNCLDCLDRTNLIQTIISRTALESFLAHRGRQAGADFFARHSTLWADNGDALSRIYAGTGALKSSFTRHGKMSLAGAFADARKSVTRAYINNFADKGRQNTIDVLLGRLMGQQPVSLHDPLSEYVNAELLRRLPEYSSTATATIWVGTYNVNGKSHGIETDLSAWLFPGGSREQEPDMYVVGFQEIVDLSPQQIMNSDPTRKKEWEYIVKKHLNEHMASLGSEERYVRLRSGQLVGAALCIYVKASALHLIKHVEGATKKTGLSGMAGNKGAVAIRMQYANTHICFVTAHLAAGFANYDERNKDFRTIHQGLRFQRNRSIDDHDTVIWLGDFNYRIGMANERVKKLIEIGDLSTLYANDQLNIQMVAGLTFPHYSESKITFMPTYKFDVGTDTYDTSEKARIPAWTDRILRKGHNIRQTCYMSADLYISDHKPVFATFEILVHIIDEAKKNALSRSIFEKRRQQIGNLIDTSDAGSDDENMGYNSVEPGLPPASSDRGKWWLANGMPARSQLQPPQKGMVPNPKRKSNPWAEREVEDWVLPVTSVSGLENVPEQRLRSGQTERVQSGTPMGGSQGSVRKKLPPPFEGQRQGGDPVKISSRAAANVSHTDEAPPLPPPRRSATVVAVAPPPSRGSDSSNSIDRKSVGGASGKAAPPVARKPIHLSGSRSPSISSPTSSGHDRTGSLNGIDPVPARTSSQRESRKMDSELPPPPRRSTRAHAASSSSSGQGQGSGNPPPPPAARRAAAVKNDEERLRAMGEKEEQKPSLPERPGNPREEVDLLGDELESEQGREIGGWGVLKPGGRGV